MTSHRGAIIGLGGSATQSHLPAFRRPELARRIEIVAGVDPVRAPEGSVGGLPVFADAERMLAEHAIDFVDIATPSATHAALAQWALERGLHVLCEKPVALTRVEAEGLVGLSRERSAVLVPCHQYRANPVWQRIRRWLEDGAIGRWHLCEIGVYRIQADRGAGSDSLPWRVRKREAGGGVLLDHGTHLLYTLLDIGGIPSGVSAWIDTLAHPTYEVEDTAQVRLEYPARVATLFLTWAARRRETRVRIVGERGSITWIDGELTLESEDAVESQDCSRELDKQSYTQWFADLFGRFADTVDAGPRSALAEAARADTVLVAALLEAAYRSASSGTTVLPIHSPMTSGVEGASAPSIAAR